MKIPFEISPIAFGCNVLGWTVNEKDAFCILDELLELNLNYLDTADVYSRWAKGHEGGESEKIIGKWLHERKNRDQIIIATKVGMDVGQGKVSLKKEHILKQINNSLKNLKTDYVDVYFAHQFDPHTPHEETLEVFNDLVKIGKVRILGASNYPLEEFKKVHELGKKSYSNTYLVNQPEYHLLHKQDVDSGLGIYCLENNIAITSYFTLASGFLTGKYSSLEDTKESIRGSRVEQYFTKTGHAVLKVLKELAQKYETDEATITLAWTLAQPAITAPIASVTKKDHFKAFKNALAIKITDEDLTLLHKASNS